MNHGRSTVGPGRGRGPQAGGALVLALLAVTAVAVLATCFLQLSSSVARRQSGALDTKRAFYVAEAGLAEAFSGLMIGKTGNVGSALAPAAFGDGLFWVEATDQGGDLVDLRSTGMSGRSRVVLSLVAERGDESVATLGVFSSDAIAIPPGTTLTGAAPPPGEPQPDGGTARVGTNGGVTISGTRARPTRVEGDVAPGPGQPLSVSGAVTITGSTEPRPAAVPLPAVEVPDLARRRGIDHSGPTPLLIQSGSAGIEYLRVAADADVIVQGPCTLVVGELSVAAAGGLELDTTAGRIDIYVDGTLELAAGASVVTSSVDPSQVSLQVPGDSPVVLAATSAFHGVIYAPEAEISVSPPFALTGALVGRRLVLTGPVSLRFDPALDLLAREMALPRLLSWRIVEMSEGGGGSAGDPFSILGVDRAALPRPADAHEDQAIHVEYVDHAGVRRDYDGPESGFDWDLVRDVTVLLRDGEKVLVGVSETPPPPPDPVAEAIRTTGRTSSGIKDYILLFSPISSEAKVAAIEKDPALGSSDLKVSLLANLPLSDVEIRALLRRATLDSSDAKALLEGNGSMQASSLQIVMDHAARLSSSDLKSVMLASSPLPGVILDQIQAGVPATLTASDRAAIIAAQ